MKFDISISESVLHSGGQIIGASASASVLPENIQDWFPIGLTSLISLLSKGLSRVFSSTTIQKNQFFNPQPSLWANSHIRTWLLEKPLFDYRDHCWQNNVSALLIQSTFVTAFLSRSRLLLISRLQLLSSLMWEPKKIKYATIFIFSHLFAMKWWDWMLWS